jgi:hypothetical protein
VFWFGGDEFGCGFEGVGENVFDRLGGFEGGRHVGLSMEDVIWYCGRDSDGDCRRRTGKKKDDFFMMFTKHVENWRGKYHMYTQ